MTDPLVLLPGLNYSPALWSALDIAAAMSPILTEPTLDGQVDRLLDELPPRFAQAVGAAFGVVATIGYATGVTALGAGATALALAAAFLNAAFAFCLGCEVLLGEDPTPDPEPIAPPSAEPDIEAMLVALKQVAARAGLA